MVEAVTNVSEHRCTWVHLFVQREVSECVCLHGDSCAADQKGESSCLVIWARATLVGGRHACTSACNGSKRKVLAVTKETGPMGGGSNGLPRVCVAKQRL